MSRLNIVPASLLVLFSTAVPATAADPESPRQLLVASHRILFLGDSITAAGPYVGAFDAWLLTQELSPIPQVINAGLPSETVSGLSEDGHAGGKFPRPDLMERLDRVLKLAKPDLIIACYGMNCGIYEPFNDHRFAKYQQGIRKLREKAAAVNAKIIHVTPPYHDGKRSPKSFDYNAVLGRYSAWLLEQRNDGWTVIDLHGPMTKAVDERRQKDAEFTFQPDGVHPNEPGHWFVASQLIRAFGDEKAAGAASAADMLKEAGLPPELLPLVQKRVNLLRDSYVGTAGHLRPGVAKGLPVEEAEKAAAELTTQIQAKRKP